MRLGLGLGLGRSQRHGGTAPAGLAAFAFQSETNTWAAQVVTNGGAAVTSRRKMNIDLGIKALKDNGCWAKIRQLVIVGPDLATSLTSLKAPGTKDATATGALTLVANTSLAGGTSKRINLNTFLDELDPANCMIGLYNTGVSSTGLVEMGATDAGGGGVGLISKQTPSTQCQGRLGTATAVALGVAADVDGSGYQALNRTGGTSFDFWKGAAKKATSATASVASPMGHVEIIGGGTNTNGTYATANKAFFGWVIGDGMTDAQMEAIANVMQAWQDNFLFGELDFYPAASLPATASYEVVVWGATSGGAVLAYEAKRRGLTVCIVRSPMEGQFGGMSANGLGQFDWLTAAAYAGLPLWLNKKAGASGLIFECLRFRRALHGLFDPRIVNGLDIPIYGSTGIASVATHLSGSDKVIDSFTTTDGRTFTATQAFADCSYEGDLAFMAGVTMTYGRDPAGSGVESNSGSTALASSFGGTVDPWVTPNTPASGLLPLLSGRADVGYPTVGTADGKLMRPNYRLTITQDALRKKPFSTTKPTGYDALGGDLLYEPLARAFANGIYTVLGDILKISGTGTVSFDVNTRGGWSTDMPGVMDGYLTKNTTDRLAVWDKVATYNQGLIWWLLNSGDARIPSAVVTSLSAYGWDHYSYCRPRAGRWFNEPQMMYVRSGYRMVSDFVLTANDHAMVDGTTPRSVKTVAMASYQMDDHGPEMWAYLSGGTTWSIGNEGAQAINTGGADVIMPVPYEIYVPKRAEGINLYVMYAASVTSLAYAAIRMEGTFMLACQFMGFAIAEKKASAVAAVQDVSYANARTAALAGTLLLTTTSTELVPVLTQVN